MLQIQPLLNSDWVILCVGNQHEDDFTNNVGLIEKENL